MTLQTRLPEPGDKLSLDQKRLLIAVLHEKQRRESLEKVMHYENKAGSRPVKGANVSEDARTVFVLPSDGRGPKVSTSMRYHPRDPDVEDRRIVAPQPGPQERWLSSSADIAIMGGAAGAGKLLPLTTKLATPAGYVTMGEVKVGDTLFGSDGKTCTVTAISAIDPTPELWEFTFDNAEKVTSCIDHQWVTYTAAQLAQLSLQDPAARTERLAKRRAARPSRSKGTRGEHFMAVIAARNAARGAAMQPLVIDPCVRTTREIVATLHVGPQKRTNHAIANAKPLDCPDAVLPLDPYLLGLWLGDGHTNGQGYTSADPELAQAFTDIGLVTELRKLGVVNNKHIPYIYLRASYAQRLALLQGLMDTDGTIDKRKDGRGFPSFTNTVEPLIDGFIRLVASLGWKSGFSTRIGGYIPVGCTELKRTKRFWTIRFAPSEIVFRLARKAAIQDTATRRTVLYRYITDAQPVASEPGRCITVDSADHTYLIGDGLLVTHNTFASLLLPLQHIHVPEFSAVFFRRNLTMIKNVGGLWQESERMYRAAGGEPTAGILRWTWPNGNQVRFSHLEHESTVYDWQGSQIALLCFDELCHFSESMFFYMLSRNRSNCGVKPYVRATCNPDADSWVATFIAWWIDEEGYPIPERSGVLRWFVRLGDTMHWADDPAELIERYGRKDIPHDHPEQVRPKSLTFVPGKLTDNSAVMSANPDYLSTLMALTRVERARLLDGNWQVRAAGGEVFRRGEFHMLDHAPDKLTVAATVRKWDLAATEPSETNASPDATAGVKMCRTKSNRYVVLDVVHARKRAHEVRDLILTTARADGHQVRIVLAQDPGQAGKDQAESLVAMLAGFSVTVERETGDKETRANPFAAQVQGGNVDIVRAQWNDVYFSELEAFPAKTAHDDMVDASAGAFGALVNHAGSQWAAFGAAARQGFR
jgi:predicted phage terminase large subunit-like protein